MGRLRRRPGDSLPLLGFCKPEASKRSTRTEPGPTSSIVELLVSCCSAGSDSRLERQESDKKKGSCCRSLLYSMGEMSDP